MGCLKTKVETQSYSVYLNIPTNEIEFVYHLFAKNMNIERWFSASYDPLHGRLHPKVQSWTFFFLIESQYNGAGISAYTTSFEFLSTQQKLFRGSTNLEIKSFGIQTIWFPRKCITNFGYFRG